MRVDSFVLSLIVGGKHSIFCHKDGRGGHKDGRGGFFTDVLNQVEKFPLFPIYSEFYSEFIRNERQILSNAFSALFLHK